MGFVADIFSATQSKKASDNQTKAMTQANQATIAEQKRQYDLSRGDQMPWLTTGKENLGYLNQLNSGDFSRFTNSPDYQFALSEGMKGLDRSAASKGRLYSGGYGEDLTRFGQGLATQNYSNYYNRLSNLAGVGQTAATNLGTLGQNYANAYGTAQNNIGNARASGYANTANAWGNAATSIGSAAGDWWGSRDKTQNGGWYLGNNVGPG
jgi:hypothetical protein